MSPIPSRLVHAIESRLRQRHIHGLALAAFDADGIRFAGGVGFADLGRAEPVTTSTVFRVASVSKLLTTATVLRSVDAGRLQLDTAANDILPSTDQLLDADDRPAPATVRSLLSHSSGLPPSARGAVFERAALTRLVNGSTPRTLADAIRGLRTVRPSGERIVYANSGFNLLGHLASLASGTSFESLARSEVFEPLGMTTSAFTTARSGPGVATPYGTIAPPKASSEPADGMQLVATPMGGLTTTVEDLARFGRMILGGGTLEGERFLPAELIDAATSVQVRNHPDLAQGYGLGFKVRDGRGRRLVGHDGNMPGVATQLVLAPDEGVGVVVLTNGFALGVPHEIAALALDELLGAAPPAEAALDSRPDPIGDVGLARRLAGRYRVDAFAPPGLLALLAGLTNRVSVIHEAGGQVRVEGNPGSDGPMWLRPDPSGSLGVSAAVDDGTNAVFEVIDGEARLWVGYTTLLRRA